MKYKCPALFNNPHIATIYPAFFRKISKNQFERKRITTNDDDFLDLDFYKQGSSKVVIISHGLEGDSQRPYILGMINIFYQNGFDVVAWNCRGCSGELNRKMSFYHSGFTTDLNRVVEEVKDYQEINLVGFSMGGNITMKYLGENSLYPLAHKIHRAVAISGALDLESCSEALRRPSNFIYMQNFLWTLKEKVRKKAAIYSDLPVDLDKLKKASNFHHFDNLVTAPLFGYRDAQDYWKQNSAVNYMANIKTPCLVMSSFDDPFLGEECFPLLNQKYISYDYSPFGGHVGFVQFSKSGFYWSEERALNFIAQIK